MRPYSGVGQIVLDIIGPGPDQDEDPEAYYEYTCLYRRECARYRSAINDGREYIYPAPGRPPNKRKEKQRKEPVFDPLPYPEMDKIGRWEVAKDGHRCGFCRKPLKGYCGGALVSYFISGGRIVYWFCSRCGWKHEPGVCVPAEQNKPEAWIGRYDNTNSPR